MRCLCLRIFFRRFLITLPKISPLQFEGVGVLPFLIGFFCVRLFAPAAIQPGQTPRTQPPQSRVPTWRAGGSKPSGCSGCAEKGARTRQALTISGSPASSQARDTLPRGTPPRGACACSQSGLWGPDLVYRYDFSRRRSRQKKMRLDRSSGTQPGKKCLTTSHGCIPITETDPLGAPILKDTGTQPVPDALHRPG